jgi:predicted nucleic acid-binding protein
MVFKFIFLDTNILVDLVAIRKVFVDDAIAIFNYCQYNKVEMFTTSHSIATLNYIAKKIVNEKELRSIIEDLLDTISIIGVNETILERV